MVAGSEWRRGGNSVSGECEVFGGRHEEREKGEESVRLVGTGCEWVTHLSRVVLGCPAFIVFNIL